MQLDRLVYTPVKFPLASLRQPAHLPQAVWIQPARPVKKLPAQDAPSTIAISDDPLHGGVCGLRPTLDGSAIYLTDGVESLHYRLNTGCLTDVDTATLRLTRVTSACYRELLALEDS